MDAESEFLLPYVSKKRKGSTGVCSTIFTIKRPAGALKRSLRRAIRTTIISTDMRAIRVMYYSTKSSWFRCE